MEVNKTLLVKLRRETLAPFSACSEALISSNNNYEEAKKALFSKSILKAKSNLSSENALPEGRVLSINSEDYTVGVMFSLRAQTDFVTNSAGFQQTQCTIGETLLNYVKTNDINTLSISEAQLIRDSRDNLTLEDKILSLSAITKEKIQLAELWISPRGRDNITLSYQHHNSKLGVLLTLKKNNPSTTIDYAELKKLALHYAAADSTFLTEDQVTTAWVNAEKQKLRENLLSKNPNIPNLDSIVEKQIRKIISDQTFSSQMFILDSSIAISTLLSKYDLTPIWAAKLSL
ncbi:translation elongation factor Ts [Candidatus Mycoplasma haematominutum]|uniref:translation elongation factor Ts n=1 Tax=Candidatus Mycoplasma haematominutum TaxID=209446 RepID=UPI00030C5933|nr:translation elongation factor Ts [Candidatus Mycoplasma haematominutum]